MTINSRDIAAAIIFKLHKYAQDLESQAQKSDAEKRHLLAVKTLALVATDRNRLDRAAKLKGRA